MIKCKVESIWPTFELKVEKCIGKKNGVELVHLSFLIIMSLSLMCDASVFNQTHLA